MKKITGSQAAAAIERLATMQTAQAQEGRSLSSSQYLGAFADRHKIDVRPGSIATLGRIVRSLDSDGIRQIRSLSDELLETNEAALVEELMALKAQLAPMDATTHQIKTRSAFITTVLRPFDSKYTSRWLSERPELDGKKILTAIENLESENLFDAESFDVWTRKVLELFEEVVVYHGDNPGSYYSRPAGTVSVKSSRTYSQSWLAFTKKFRDHIWTLASGGQLQVVDGFELSKSLKSRTVDNLSIVKESPAIVSKRPQATEINSHRLLSATKTSLPQMVISTDSKTQNVEWIQVFIESKLDSTAQASRKWESHNEFKDSLQKWLDTFPIIWGDAAKGFWAKVSVKTSTGESDLTLPTLTVDSGAERLLKAIEMQIN